MMISVTAVSSALGHALTTGLYQRVFICLPVYPSVLVTHGGDSFLSASSRLAYRFSCSRGAEGVLGVAAGTERTQP